MGLEELSHNHHGQYEGKEKVAIATLEAIDDERLYIWNAFFGMPGCSNEITVYDVSTIPGKMSSGTFPCSSKCKINGFDRNKPCLLAIGIYPKAPLFVHSIANPDAEAELYFAGGPEGRRKDIERAFGVL